MMSEVPDNNQQPKCLRIVVTSFFADGSSSVIDIPEPEEVKDESRVLEEFQDEWYSRFPISSLPYEFVLRARVNPEIPMRLLVLPIPKTEDEDPSKLRLERRQWLRDQDKSGR